MTRTVVLPSREHQSADSVASEATVQYVEDWFEYEQFDEAFSVLLDFDSEVPEDSPWRSQGIGFWRIYLRSFFLQSWGNFKHLYPITNGLATILEESPERVVFIWPSQDIVTDLVERMSTVHRNGDAISIQTDSSQLNPIPSVYHGDNSRANQSTSGLRLGFKAFVYLLGVHLLLIAGQLLPKTELDSDHLIDAHPDHREVTDTILESDGVVTSLLNPRLLPVVRSLVDGDIGEVRRQLDAIRSGARVGAEDVFRGELFTLDPYRTMYRLLRTRRTFDSRLQDHLVDHDFPLPSTDYLDPTFELAFSDPSSLKYIAYISLFEDAPDISTLTSVSGGNNQSFLFEIGSKFGIETVDMNHSVLMNEPPEIRNRADTVVVKGKPDLERLEREDTSKRLVPAGRPYNDRLYRLLGADEPGDLPDVYEADNTLLVATEPIRDEHIVRVLRQSFASESADSICIKLHPKENIAHYDSVLSRVDTGDTDYKIVAQEYDVFDLIWASDAVVNVSSNVGLEALLFGVPGIHIGVPPNVELYYQTHPYFEQFMTDVDGATETIDRYLRDGIDPETVREVREMYYFDGRASERVLEAIYE